VSTNTAVGAAALNNGSLSGGENVGLGYNSAQGLTTGVRNTILGSQSGQNLTTGSDNILIGYRTVYNATSTGSNNVAVGSQSLYSNTTASNCTAVGYQAAYSNTTGEITAFGRRAGYANTTANACVYVGDSSGLAATGSSNTFIGYDSGNAITTGAKNTIIGKYTGNNGGLDIRTASNKIVLSDGDGNPAVYIDNPNANTAVFANSATGNRYAIFGMSINSVYKSQMYWDNTDLATYVQSGGTGGVYLGVNGNAWVSVSDERLKENLVAIENGLSKVCSLRSVTGNFIDDESKKSKSFLIAQDVQAVLPEAVSTSTQKDSDTEYLGVAYSDVIPLLVAAIKELKAEFDAYKASHP
jgi:hypothetical protein